MVFIYVLTKNGACGPDNERLVISRELLSQEFVRTEYGWKGIADVRVVRLAEVDPNADVLPTDRVLEETG